MIDVLTTTLTKLCQPLPRMSAAMKQWFRDNLWIIMLLVAIVNAGYGVSLLIQLYQAFTSKVGTLLMMVAPQASSSLTARRVYLVVALLCVITQGIIAGLAVLPLRERRKQGWVLAVCSALVIGLFAVIGFILNIFMMPLAVLVSLMSLLFALAALYVAYEVKDEF
jgi:hypothetical protein